MNQQKSQDRGFPARHGDTPSSLDDLYGTIHENPIRVDDDWGYPHEWKAPYVLLT